MARKLSLYRKSYWFDGLDYSLWFDNLRGEDGYNTDIYEGEEYELQLTWIPFIPENLFMELSGSRHETGRRSRRFKQWEGEPFWSEDENYAPHIYISGDGLKAAEASLDEGRQYIAVRATVKLNESGHPWRKAGTSFKQSVNMIQCQIGNF